MNRLTWLRVWGFNSLTQDRKQSSPTLPPHESEALAALMRRLSDLAPITHPIEEAVEA
jgi:hypothetical protein